MEHLVSPDTKAFATELVSRDLVVSGYAIRWWSVDRENEMFAPGALAKSIKSFLAGPSPLLLNHNSAKRLGRVTALEEREDGVYFEAVVPEVPESSPLRHVYELLKRNMVAGVSIGGVFRRRAKANGAQRIESADLWEISLAPVPMDPSTSAQVTIVQPDGELVAQKAVLEDQFMSEADRRIALAGMRLDVAAIRLAARGR